MNTKEMESTLDDIDREIAEARTNLAYVQKFLTDWREFSDNYRLRIERGIS